MMIASFSRVLLFSSALFASIEASAAELTPAPTADIIGGAHVTISPTFERQQYMLGPEKWGSPSLGTAGEIPWSFFDAANGSTRAQPNGRPYIDTAVKARQKATLRQAQRLWEQVANVHFVEGSDSNAVTRVRVGQGNFGAGLDDGSISFAFADLPCALCLSARGPNLVTFSTQLFQDSRQSETALLDIALHEFGHTIGLQHELNKSSVMGQGQRAKSFIGLKGLTDDDIAAARALYGANPNPVKIIDDDVEGTASTDTMLTPGQVFAGRIETPADEDWFRAQLVPGNDYIITARPAGTAPLARASLTLLINEGSVTDTAAWPLMTTASPSDGAAAVIAITPRDTGFSWIAVKGAAETLTGGYTLDIQQVVRDAIPLAAPLAAAVTASSDVVSNVTTETTDFPADMSSPAVLSPGLIVRGGVGANGDAADWIKLKLPPYHRYVITLTGVDGGGGTLSDPVLRLRGPEGQVYGVRDDTAGTHDASLIFYQNFDEDDWLEVTGFGASAGTYTLGVSEISLLPSAIDVVKTAAAPNAAATGAVLPLDLPMDGRIATPMDFHAYRALMSAGNTYTITAQPTSTGGAQQLWIALEAPDGSLVSQAKAVIGQPVSLQTQPFASGVYIVHVASYDFHETGGYRVTLSLNPRSDADDAPDTLYYVSAPRVIAGGGIDLTLNGIDDRDWIEASLTPGVWYLVNAAPSSGATMTAPPIVGLGGAQFTNIDNYHNAPLAMGGYDSSSVYVRSMAGGTTRFFVFSNAFGAAFGDGHYRVTLAQADPPPGLLTTP